MDQLGVEALHERVCPVCDTACADAYMESNYDRARLNKYSFASRKNPELMHYRLVLCPRCDLLYASPAPEQSHLARLYKEAEYDSREEARFAARTYMKAVSKYLHRLPDYEGALDIGAGDGAFLERVIDAGFSGVQGVEPSETPVRAARADIAPLIRNTIFKAEDFSPRSFRLVTCFQTFEHLHSPSTISEAVYGLLKSPGIFFTVMHNHRSFSARVMGGKSPIFDIEHLQLFSPASVKYMLEKAGFKEVEVFPVSNIYPLRYWLRLLPLPARLKRGLIAAADKAGLGGLPTPVRAGNMAAIGFKG